MKKSPILPRFQAKTGQKRLKIGSFQKLCSTYAQPQNNIKFIRKSLFSDIHTFTISISYVNKDFATLNKAKLYLKPRLVILYKILLYFDVFFIFVPKRFPGEFCRRLYFDAVNAGAHAKAGRLRIRLAGSNKFNGVFTLFKVDF